MFAPDGSLDTSEYGHSLAAVSGIRDAKLPWHAKLVAFVLISRARPSRDEGWVCWPSLQTIARDCSISRSQIIRALRALNDAGLVCWDRGDCTSSNRYTLDFAAMQDLRKPGKGRKSR